jgi:hypothetical protein
MLGFLSGVQSRPRRVAPKEGRGGRLYAQWQLFAYPLGSTPAQGYAPATIVARCPFSPTSTNSEVIVHLKLKNDVQGKAVAALVAFYAKNREEEIVVQDTFTMSSSTSGHSKASWEKSSDPFKDMLVVSCGQHDRVLVAKDGTELHLH